MRAHRWARRPGRVHDVNPGAGVERDLCLTVVVGAGAAAECGDLRLVHVLPTAHAEPGPHARAPLQQPARPAPGPRGRQRHAPAGDQWAAARERHAVGR